MKETVSSVVFLRRLSIGVLLINLFIIALAGISVRQSRLQYEEQATITTLNLSQVLDEYINGVITKSDVTLLSVVDEAEKQLSGGGINKQALNTYIVRQHSRIPELYALRMTNAKGDVAYGTDVVPGHLVNAADRDYFIRPRIDPKGGFFISKPLFGRMTRKWVINFARRYNRPDGSFAGVVLGTITLENFAKMFSRINVGKHGVITVFDGELSVISRYPEPQGIGSAIGKTLKASQLRGLFQQNQTAATYNTRSTLDGIERIFSFRKISSYPLYVIVGLAKDDYLTEWRNETAKMSALVGLFFLVVLCLAWLLYRDITERKLAEKELKASEEKYRALIETTDTGFVILNKNGLVLDANSEYVRLTGYQRLEEIFGRSVIEWTADHDRARNALEVRMCFEKGFVRNLNIDYADKNGTITSIEINATVVDTENGPLIVTLCRDVTERKKVEDELLKSRKLESVSILSKGIAHDFNNLLTSVLGYISLSKTLVPPSDQAHEYLAVAESACVKAKELTQQLDHLNQFASGVTLVRKTSSVVRLLQDSSGLLSKNENIKVNIWIPDKLWPAEIDERQISQVMHELIKNAGEAMPNGGVIDIVAQNTVITNHDLLSLQEGHYIKISVKDHGIGMAKENLSNIFEPYFTTKQMDYRSGVGLGLALCYSIVKGHKGNIVVESELGKGTVVHVYLPASSPSLTSE